MTQTAPEQKQVVDEFRKQRITPKKNTELDKVRLHAAWITQRLHKPNRNRK